MNTQVAPSILAADFGNLERDISMINQSEADWLHVDVMDGQFVPVISFGQNIVKRMGQLSEKPLDVHLMIEQPKYVIQQFVESGAEMISVHFEACTHLHRVIQQIKSFQVRASVAINPHTNIHELDYVLEDLDMICIMSVNPGYGGQKFIPQTLRKIEALRNRILQLGLETWIEVDGGVGLKNAKSVVDAGANVLVAGSAVFKSEDPLQTIQELKNF